MTRAAVYCRVSTRYVSVGTSGSGDRNQHPENQLRELLAEAGRLGYEVPQELQYTDRETGTGKRRRGQFEKMIYDAEHGRFKLLCVWALDRLSREGTLKTLLLLERLGRCGVKVKSLKEPWLDPSSPTYELLLPIFAWVAKAEATRISDRVRAGLERAKAMGVRLGRPPREDVDPQKVLEAHQRLGSVRDTARSLGLSRSMVHRVLKGIRNGSGNSAGSNGNGLHQATPATDHATGVRVSGEGVVQPSPALEPPKENRDAQAG